MAGLSAMASADTIVCYLAFDHNGTIADLDRPGASMVMDALATGPTSNIRVPNDAVTVA